MTQVTPDIFENRLKESFYDRRVTLKSFCECLMRNAMPLLSFSMFPCRSLANTCSADKHVLPSHSHAETDEDQDLDALTFFGQMMCGANMVARLMADILLTCWLRAVWYSKSSRSFNRLRLAGGSSMKSSCSTSICRSLSGTSVLLPQSSKRVNPEEMGL